MPSESYKREDLCAFPPPPTFFCYAFLGHRCVAAAGSVTIMIPMDTVKTRLVTQLATSESAYGGILNCFTRMLREEGIGSFYNSLTPRLVSVVPMIGVQYFVYEVGAVFQSSRLNTSLVGRPGHVPRLCFISQCMVLMADCKY